MARRIDVVGVLLVALAAYAAWRTYDPRMHAARWYAEAADYNRAITRFLADHRERIAGRPVAVYGVAGLSPWSLSAGGYLARILGGDHRWDVFVPAPDLFYPVGTLPGGSITVHTEDRACTVAADPRTAHLAIAPDGRGRFADDCRQAIALVTPQPAIDDWGPRQVNAAQRDAGFNMYFTGRDLVRGVEVRVQGRPTPMTYAKQGTLMTTAVPPQPGAGAGIPFTVIRRGDVVASGTVAVQ